MKRHIKHQINPKLNPKLNPDINTFICKKCNYLWQSKLKAPKACPRCKSYCWDQDFINNYTQEVKGKNNGGSWKLGKIKPLDRAY